MAVSPQWSFAGYTFPFADSPRKGGSEDFNPDEKLIEHDPLNANITILSSWGFTSARRTIQGTCSAISRDQLKALWLNRTVGTLIDAESRSVQARITNAKFETMIPEAAISVGSGLYRYTITFRER